MTSNDNTAAQMLLFPHQLAEPESFADCDDIGVLYFQLRLWAIKAITAVKSGKSPFTEDFLKSLNDTNDLFREWGKPQLEFSFEN